MILLNTGLDITMVIGIILFIVLVIPLAIFVPVGLWITARFSGVKLNIGQLIGMRLRRVPPKLIVDELIKASKAGLEKVSFNKVETHYLAHGNISVVIDALIAAKHANIALGFEQAAAIDLAGRDLLQAVKDSVNPKVIDSPQIEAVSKDGIQLLVKARITVIAHIDKLIGGAGEETIIARVGEGIVSAVGSSHHAEVLESPTRISEQILGDGLTARTAYDVISIDIADVDVGKSIGAILKADEAEADLKVAQAKAEEKRAEAVAEEQYFRAQVQRMKAKLIEAESQVPLAISDAFRIGKLGIMDYHRLQNMDADTRMRRSFSEMETEEEPSIDSNDSSSEKDKH